MTKKINIEQLFISTLGSPQKLKWYLQYDINAIYYMEQTRGGIISFIDVLLAFVPRNKRREIVGNLNKKRILKILDRERLDLYKIINTKRGLAWIDKQIINFENRFIN